MKNPLGDIMKQAQDMQGQLQRAQEELAGMEVTGEAGAGLVKVVMTGRHDVRRVSIDATLHEERDRELLEDLIAAAVNDAVQKVEAKTKEKFAGLASGLSLPAGLKLPL